MKYIIKLLMKFVFKYQAVQKPNMEKVFFDSKQRWYYKYTSEFDMPIIRVKELEKYIMLVNYSLTDEVLTKFLDAMHKAINSKKVDIATLSFLVIEMQKRKDLLINEDLFFNILACALIREDEDLGVFDEKIHEQKVAQFKLDSQGGLYDFFYKNGLGNYVTYLSKLENDWKSISEENRIQIMATNKWLENYLTK